MMGIPPLTVEGVHFDAVQTVLQLGSQYQFGDDDPNTLIVLDPSFRGEEALYEYVRNLVTGWAKRKLSRACFDIPAPAEEA